jgi:membrane protein implicated in regulation of membrane protease activity
MDYRTKRHITNTLLWVVIITALAGVIKQYTTLGMAAFLVVSVVALAADRWVENRHNKGEGR